MKKLLLLCPILLSALLSCKRDGDQLDVETQDDQKIAKQQEQFHGKYRLVSSVSSEGVDINMDGVASANLFEEIDILPSEKFYHFDVEVRIYDTHPLSPEPVYLFNQAWPEQYIRLDGEEWTGGPGLNYNPSLRMDFLRQGTPRNFEFSEDMKLLNVLSNEEENPYRWLKPVSVEVTGSGRLTVVNKRYLYTKSGVKEVLVTSVYERYTKQT